MRIPSLLLIMCLALTGCAKHVAVHPGAISNLDSYAYDLLLVESSVIDQAKADFLAGSLPSSAKDPINLAIHQYNATQEQWQQYHANGANADVLQNSLDALVLAIGQLTQFLGKKPPATLKPMDYQYTKVLTPLEAL